MDRNVDLPYLQWIYDFYFHEIGINFCNSYSFISQCLVHLKSFEEYSMFQYIFLIANTIESLFLYLIPSSLYSLSIGIELINQLFLYDPITIIWMNDAFSCTRHLCWILSVGYS